MKILDRSKLNHINVTVGNSNVQQDIKTLIFAIKSEWNVDDIKIKAFTDGCTNSLYGVYIEDNLQEADAILVRVFGEKTELLIDRDSELRTMLMLEHFKMCGKFYATFNNGLCYEYIQGQVADCDIMRNPNYSCLIAEEFARLHTLPVKEYLGVTNPEPYIFTKCTEWLEMIRNLQFPNPELQQRFEKTCPSFKELSTEFNELVGALSPLDVPIVFCHNDVLAKNLILSPKKDRVYMIDYEYAAFNFSAFDIGNHFCEFAGMHVVDYDLYPPRDMQLLWLRHYLHCRATFEKKDTNISETDVLTLYAQANKFALLSHLFWAFWALLQSQHSTIDFDYLGYCQIRYNEYKRRKSEFLAIELP